MSESSGLGVLLRSLRERREISLRAAGQEANVDHAYIYRLEKGDKESPSAEVMGRLLKIFNASEKEAEMAAYLAAHPDVDPDLVDYVWRHEEISFEIFSIAAGTRFRGGGRPDPETLIKRIQSAFED